VFKNLMFFEINPEWSQSAAEVEKCLQGARFVPCAATQTVSRGWVEPRGIPHGPLVESIDGQMLLKLQVESKNVPGSAIKRRVAELVKRIEDETGRKPGRREKKELKEQALLDLLPMAFSKVATIDVWIDPKRRLLMVGASSQSRSDEVLTELVRTLENFSVLKPQTQRSAQSLMADWLLSFDPPECFSIGRDCELKSSDETKASVRYARHSLDADDVKQHIEAGKLPTKLALTWNDRVAFHLTESAHLRKIEFLEGTMDGRGGPDEDRFDTDAAIATGELASVLDDLLAALGKPEGAGEE